MVSCRLALTVLGILSVGCSGNGSTTRDGSAPVADARAQLDAPPRAREAGKDARSSAESGASDGGDRDATSADARTADADAPPSAESGASDGGQRDVTSVDAQTACAALGTSAWFTYGHDAQRTFASDGCATGPLSLAWTFVPAKIGSGIVSVDHAIAANGALYLTSVQNGPGGATPVQDKVSTTGTSVWQWSQDKDVSEHHWTTFAFGKLLVDDDGLFLVDDVAPNTATKTIQPYDDWGMNTADSTSFYTTADVNSPDGPGLYVGAYTPQGTTKWRKNTYKNCGSGGSETTSSLALDGGNVFQAGVYLALTGTAPFSSGVRSFNASTGAPGWTQATTPLGAISISAGTVFLVEKDATTALVARRETDGTIFWSTPLTSAAITVQAPVQAAGLVILATSDGITAYAASTGTKRWSVANVIAVEAEFKMVSNWDRCSTNSTFGTVVDTSMAAATGSGTLVVTAQDGLHVLALSDGHAVWSGAIAGVTGPLKNPVIVGSEVYAIDTGVGKGQLVALKAL